MIEINDIKEIPESIKKWFEEETDESLNDLDFDDAIEGILEGIQIDIEDGNKKLPKPKIDKKYSLIEKYRSYELKIEKDTLIIVTHWNENNKDSNFLEYCEPIERVYIK